MAPVNTIRSPGATPCSIPTPRIRRFTGTSRGDDQHFSPSGTVRCAQRLCFERRPGLSGGCDGNHHDPALAGASRSANYSGSTSVVSLPSLPGNLASSFIGMQQIANGGYVSTNLSRSNGGRGGNSIIASQLYARRDQHRHDAVTRHRFRQPEPGRRHGNGRRHRRHQPAQ